MFNKKIKIVNFKKYGTNPKFAKEKNLLAFANKNNFKWTDKFIYNPDFLKIEKLRGIKKMIQNIPLIEKNENLDDFYLVNYDENGGHTAFTNKKINKNKHVAVYLGEYDIQKIENLNKGNNDKDYMFNLSLHPYAPYAFVYDALKYRNIAAFFQHLISEEKLTYESFEHHEWLKNNIIAANLEKQSVFYQAYEYLSIALYAKENIPKNTILGFDYGDSYYNLPKHGLSFRHYENFYLKKSHKPIPVILFRKNFLQNEFIKKTVENLINLKKHTFSNETKRNPLLFYIRMYLYLMCKNSFIELKSYPLIEGILNTHADEILISKKNLIDKTNNANIKKGLDFIRKHLKSVLNSCCYDLPTAFNQYLFETYKNKYKNIYKKFTKDDEKHINKGLNKIFRIAINTNKIDDVKKIIDFVDIKATNSNNQTPLQIATKRNHTKIANLIKERLKSI